VIAKEHKKVITVDRMRFASGQPPGVGALLRGELIVDARSSGRQRPLWIWNMARQRKTYMFPHRRACGQRDRGARRAPSTSSQTWT